MLTLGPVLWIWATWSHPCSLRLFWKSSLGAGRATQSVIKVWQFTGSFDWRNSYCCAYCFACYYGYWFPPSKEETSGRFWKAESQKSSNRSQWFPICFNDWDIWSFNRKRATRVQFQRILELHATGGAANPAYVSVSVPKPSNKMLSHDGADTILEPQILPPSLCGYIEWTFSD